MSDSQKDCFSFRWGIPSLDQNHVEIPNCILQYHAKVGLKGSKFVLIVHLAAFHYESRQGQSRPSQRTLAERMGVTVRRIRQLLKELREDGWLICEELEREDGGRATNLYNAAPFAKECFDMWKEEEYGEGVRGDEQISAENTPRKKFHAPPEENFGGPLKKISGANNINSNNSNTNVVKEEEYKESTPQPKNLSDRQQQIRSYFTGSRPQDESDSINNLNQGQLVQRIVAFWIDEHGDFPDSVVSEQSGFAKQVVKKFKKDNPSDDEFDFDIGSLMNALLGIGEIYPHSEGEPWDMSDLKKKASKAIAAAQKVNKEADNELSATEISDLKDKDRIVGPGPDEDRWEEIQRLKQEQNESEGNDEGGEE